MIKKRLAVFIIACILVFIVSCSGSIDSSDGNQDVITLSMTDLGFNPIAISANTNISLNNMDPDKVYGVRVFNNEETSNCRSNSSSGVFKGSDNTYIPIPDESNCSDFYGSSLGIRDDGNIRIIELNSSDGPMVLSEFADHVSYYTADGARVYEKFFNVNFSKEPYRHFDKSRVAILMYQTGSGSGISLNWGYVTNGFGGLKPEGFTPGLYDFSMVNHINLYIYNKITESNGRISNEMIVMNSVVCSEYAENELVSKLGVYSFIPSNKEEKYVMIINKKEGYFYSDDFNLRMIDGAFSGFVLPLSSDGEKDVYYLGALESELLVDIGLYSGSGFGTDLGSVVFRPATENEVNSFYEHVISVNYDKTVFSKILKPGDSKFVFYFEPNGDFVPNNSLFRVEYKYDDGSYVTEHVYSYVKSGHTSGVGYSGNGLVGSNCEFRIPNREYIMELSLDAGNIDKTINVTITLERNE